MNINEAPGTLDGGDILQIGKHFVHALAMDIDQGGYSEGGCAGEGHLVFPAPGHRRILVPLPEARRLARQTGQTVSDDFLTGLYWRLRLSSGDEKAWQAEPLEVLI